MTDISSINLGQVTYTTNNSNSKPATTENKDDAPATQQAETKQVSADAVLSYMANAANIAKANISVSPLALVSKYNSPEAIARISAMMGEFESGVIAGLAKFEEEMGASFANLSDEDKMALAAAFYASETQE